MASDLRFCGNRRVSHLEGWVRHGQEGRHGERRGNEKHGLCAWLGTEDPALAECGAGWGCREWGRGTSWLHNRSRRRMGTSRQPASIRNPRLCIKLFNIGDAFG